MSNLNLGGFDVVVHLAESVINQGLGLLPNGSTFPVQQRQNVILTALGVPVPGVGSTPKDVPLLYDAFLEVERPQVTLNQSTGRVTVRCALSPASELTFLRPSLAADAALLTAVVAQIPVAGSVQLDCAFGVQDVSAVWGNQAVSGRAAVAHAAAVGATISLTVPSADGSGNVLLASSAVNGTAVQVTTAAIQTVLQTATGTGVGDAIGDLPLTNPVRLNSGATPVQTVQDLQAQISPMNSPRAISLGVLTAITPHDPVGAIPAPPAPLSTAGAVIWGANYWTVHLVCSLLNSAHPGLSFSFTTNPPSALFHGAVTVPGGQQPITIVKLAVTVDPTGAGLLVNGSATASGSCWDASFDFDFNFTFACDHNSGSVLPAASVPNVTNFNVNKDIWCEIIGIVVGAVVGFITGAIIGALVGGWGALIGGIIGAVVGGIAGGLAVGALLDPLSIGGVSLDGISVLAGLTLPLPVGGVGLLVQDCSFDDLGVVGELVYVDLAERYRSGSVRLAIGAAFDLDSGVIRTGVSGTNDTGGGDLLWTGSALQALAGAVYGVVYPANGDAFGRLSLTDLQGFTYSGHAIPAAEIPVALLVALRMINGVGGIGPATGGNIGVDSPERWVSFALRTNEGRYAKCRACRNISGNLTLDYIVYASPKICLGSVITLETVSQTMVDSGTDTCTDVQQETPACMNVGIIRVVPPIRPADLKLSALEVQVGRTRTSSTILVSLGDLIPPIGPILPPKCQPSCGPQITIEQTQMDWQLVDRQQRATIEALPSGVVAPLTYQWTVFGTDLPDGSGTMDIGSIAVTYDKNSPILTLLASEQQDLIGSIVANATDADGRTLTFIRQINSPSRKRLGGCCPSTHTKLTPNSAAVQLETARTIQRFYEAGVARLQQIALSGRVQETSIVSLASAVQRLAANGPSTSGRKSAPKMARANRRKSRKPR
jgi:hypothetical protein